MLCLQRALNSTTFTTLALRRTVAPNSSLHNNGKSYFFSTLQSKNIARTSSRIQGIAPSLNPSFRSFSSSSPSSSKSPFRAMIIGGAVLGVTAAIYSSRFQGDQKPNLRSGKTIESSSDSMLLKRDDLPRDISVSRQVRFECSDKNDLPTLARAGIKRVLLFQYQSCPFCCKTRAFLDFFGVDYDVVEVNSVTRKQVKWSPYKKVPMVVVETVDGQLVQLKDSTLIISALASFLQDKTQSLAEVTRCYPLVSFSDDSSGKARSEIMNKYFLMFRESPKSSESEKSVLEERKWRKWADDELVHMISPNVYRTMDEAFSTFWWFDKVGQWEKEFTKWERLLVVYVGAPVMYLIGKRLKKKYGLKDDVRSSLYDSCNTWTRALKQKGTTFMGGKVPNLADLAVYGTLKCMEGCEAFQDLMNNTKIGPWYKAMTNAVQVQAGRQLVLNRSG